MVKIVFLGAGSTVFVKNVLGDCMCSEALRDSEFCLYDINAERLEESRIVIEGMNKKINESKAVIKTFLGESQRKDALRGADFIVNAIQVGGYEPCTVTDFEVPTKYGLRQTIGDTLGVGGIMRALRTIPVLEEFAKDIEEVCPNALFINYTNPMGILTGFMQRCTIVRTIGICHSVQACANTILEGVGLSDKIPGHKELIAGINHMAWLLDIRDKDGNDLYPEIRKRAKEKNAKEKHLDMVRFEYIDKFGYYCTESSEHNAEYNPYFIKRNYPELIERFNIPLDEYPKRCESQIDDWKSQKNEILSSGSLNHKRSIEYASRIIESIVTDMPYKFGGNVINNGCIENLDPEACVEVPCLADGYGVHPLKVGKLPVQLAAMNASNINPQMMTIQAAFTKKKEDIYRAVMFDPRASSELSVDDIIRMCDELIEKHGDYMKMYH